jgi:glycosyltransferase involved in cell wall biosynthesis
MGVGKQYVWTAWRFFYHTKKRSCTNRKLNLESHIGWRLSFAWRAIMKIIVYGIAKNEAQHVKRFMDSIREADGVYICDTGSTDGTQNLLKQEGAIVNEITVIPWRFDLARNMALMHVPECDVCLCLDLDEIMLPKWRQGIEKAWKNGVTELRYPYVFNWEDEAQTIPRLEMYNFKIHARHGYTWHYPIHEIIAADGEAKTGYTEEVICHHHPDLTKERNYQKLLDLAVEEYPQEQRFSHLRGRELMMFGRPQEAIEELKRHLILTQPYTDDYGGIAQTRAMSMRYIARCIKALEGNPEHILQWMLRACSESPYQRESWVWLAQAWADIGDFAQAYACCKTGLRITDKKLSIECEGICWGEYPEKLMEKAKERL